MELDILESMPSLATAGSKTSLEVLDIHSTKPGSTMQSKRISTVQLLDASSVRHYLRDSTTASYESRIILLTKANSWARLDLGKAMLQEVLTHYNVTVEFLQLIYSSRRQINRLEEAYADGVWTHNNGVVIETTYMLKHPEPRGKLLDNKPQWSIRQTGVYHAYNITSHQSTWILILPNRDPSIRREIMDKLDTLHEHPLQMHMFFLQARLGNWRLYISHFEKQVWELADLALTIDIGRDLSFGETYKDLSSLHYIETRLAPVPPLLDAHLDLTTQLSSLSLRLQHAKHITEKDAVEVRDSLQNLCARIRSYKRNSEFVLSKIKGTTQLVSDTISLKNQHTSSHLSNQMLSLNRSAVEDSTSMRVITLVTLVYLPSSFVSTFFGMGFFSSDRDADSGWSMSSYVWVFFVISVPLTLVTLGYWRWSLGKAVRSRAAKEAAKWIV